MIPPAPPRFLGVFSCCRWRFDRDDRNCGKDVNGRSSSSNSSSRNRRRHWLGLGREIKNDLLGIGRTVGQVVRHRLRGQAREGRGSRSKERRQRNSGRLGRGDAGSCCRSGSAGASIARVGGCVVERRQRGVDRGRSGGGGGSTSRDQDGVLGLPSAHRLMLSFEVLSDSVAASKLSQADAAPVGLVRL